MRDYVMVVGSGMMGSGIGAMSALAGNKTVLILSLIHIYTTTPDGYAVDQDGVWQSV